MLAAGLYAARRSPSPRAVGAITALLAVVAIVERIVPPPASVPQLAASALAAYVLFSLAAARVDRAERAAER